MRTFDELADLFGVTKEQMARLRKEPPEAVALVEKEMRGVEVELERMFGGIDAGVAAQARKMVQLLFGERN